MAKRPVATINDRLGEMLKQEPFQPFDIKTADGDTIHVVHPDFAIRSPGGQTAVVFDRDDHMRIINLQMAVTLEPKREQTAKKGKR
jgi:hypothetical protein